MVLINSTPISRLSMCCQKILGELFGQNKTFLSLKKLPGLTNWQCELGLIQPAFFGKSSKARCMNPQDQGKLCKASQSDLLG